MSQFIYILLYVHDLLYNLKSVWFLGETCNFVQGSCDEDTCRNWGSCQQHTENVYTCNCSPGFTGRISSI